MHRLETSSASSLVHLLKVKCFHLQLLDTYLYCGAASVLQLPNQTAALPLPAAAADAFRATAACRKAPVDGLHA